MRKIQFGSEHGTSEPCGKQPEALKWLRYIMRDYRLDILGVSKCRWRGSGRNRVGDKVEILYSKMPEGEPHVHGAALILSPNIVKSILKFRPVNERIITARLQGKNRSMTVVQCYAPTNDSSEDEKYQFY